METAQVQATKPRRDERIEDLLEDLSRRLAVQEDSINKLAQRAQFSISPVWSERIILFGRVCAITFLLGCVGYGLYWIAPGLINAIPRLFSQKVRP